MENAQMTGHTATLIGEAPDYKRIEQSEAYNFVWFSQVHEYRQVNRALVLRALRWLPTNIKQLTHVDNGTGTGLVPQLAGQLYHERGIKATIIGIDPDGYALKRAAESLRNTEYVRIRLFQGYGHTLEKTLNGHIPEEGADVVSIHDAIHEIAGRDMKMAVFASQAKLLKPGGIQMYNSSFTTIGNGDAAFKWGRWRMGAFAYFNEKRNMDKGAMEVFSPEEYAGLITDAGLQRVHEDVHRVVLSLDALKAISRYPEFVAGIFRDMENTEKYTLPEKSKALITVLEKQGVTSLPRLWHEVIARKPPSGM